MSNPVAAVGGTPTESGAAQTDDIGAANPPRKMEAIAMLSGSTRLMRKKLLVAGATMVFPIASYAVDFSDAFEGQTFDSFWTANGYYGSASLSSDVSHSGAQSVKLSTLSGSPTYTKDAQLYHTFAGPVSSAYFSVWLYDTSPGLQTNYAGIGFTLGGPSGFPGGNGAGAGGIRINDWDPTYYAASLAGSTGQTSVVRTLGWHHFEVNIGEGFASESIDGIVVGTGTAPIVFDTVALDVQAPYWRPNATFYLDDFTVQTQAVPEPATFLFSAASFGYLMRRRVASRRKRGSG